MSCLVSTVFTTALLPFPMLTVYIPYITTDHCVIVAAAAVGVGEAGAFTARHRSGGCASAAAVREGRKGQLSPIIVL